MRNLSLATVGAVCALAAVAGFLLGVVLMISTGVGTLIEGLTTIGFLGFFVFMASMGIAILLRCKRSGTEFASTAAV